MKLIKVSKNISNNIHENEYSSGLTVNSSEKFNEEQRKLIEKYKAEGKKYIVFTKGNDGAINVDAFAFDDEESKNRYIKSIMSSRDGFCTGVEVVRLF